MKNRVTIVPSDNLIIVDGILLKFEFQAPNNLNAIQWNGNTGHCEYTDRENKDLTEEDYEREVAPYVTLWENEKLKLDEEYNKPENVYARMKSQYISNIQLILDTEAQKLGYDNCLSVCSYMDTGVKKYDDESTAFRAWRSSIWKVCYEILSEIEAGSRDFPTKDELITLLPKLNIIYSE